MEGHGLIRAGQTVDILFDVSNPGLWMAHCHIAEHMQSGMMFSFTVARSGREVNLGRLTGWPPCPNHTAVRRPGDRRVRPLA